MGLGISMPKADGLKIKPAEACQLKTVNFNGLTE
jgi:hypothetical protein